MSMTKTENTINIINVTVFTLVLGIGGLASLSMKKQAVSEIENRQLTPFPAYSDSALWSGNYFRQVDQYYADNFPLRNRWINVSGSFRNKFGFESGDIKIYEPANDAEANEITDTTKNTVNSGPLPDDGAVEELKNGKRG